MEGKKISNYILQLEILLLLYLKNKLLEELQMLIYSFSIPVNTS